MNEQVGAVVTALGKCFLAGFARVRSFASVRARVGLEITILREPLVAALKGADKRTITRVRASVDYQVCLLAKRLVTVREITLVLQRR